MILTTSRRSAVEFVRRCSRIREQKNEDGNLYGRHFCKTQNDHEEAEEIADDCLLLARLNIIIEVLVYQHIKIAPPVPAAAMA
jgi:hypothetical protein